METVCLSLNGEEAVLSPLRALFLPRDAVLVVSDLHVGKTAHFRKHGIPVSAEVLQRDLQRLANLVSYFVPRKIIVVGDMFHRDYNSDVAGFALWRRSFHHVDILLVAGNHDTRLRDRCGDMQITVQDEEITAAFHFVHERPAAHTEKYCICGHVHPGVHLQGPARQSVTMPCFVKHPRFLILPAFSEFTGLDMRTGWEGNHTCYGIAGGRFFEIGP